MVECAAGGLPFQLNALERIKGKELVREVDGRLETVVATGDYRGASWGLLAGRARCVVVPGGDEIWDYPAVLLFGHMKAIGDENLIFDVLVDLAANLPPTDDDVV